MHTRFDDVGRGNAIIGLGLYIRLYDVRREMPSFPLESIHYRTTSGVAMVLWPLVNTHCQSTSAVKCNHFPWTTYMVGLQRVWHVVIALELHTRSDNVGHVMPAWPL